MKDLAPIGISTYSRINHLTQTIEALRKNTLANQSELYIFSDAPKEGDEEIVAEIREYIKTIDGFKKVYIIEREKNGRVANNRNGIKQLLNKHGKMIWLEDDIVTASGFLTFMNKALDFYEDDDRVLSITGYSPPIKSPKEYNKDIFLLQRFSGWGFATWKDKFDPYRFELSKYEITKFLDNNIKIEQFKKNGKDMFETLLKQYYGEFNGLDVQVMFYQFQHDLFTIYPIESLVQNIGFDGSGLHSEATNKFHIDRLWDKKDNFMFKKNITVDERIRKSNYNFRSSNEDYRNLSLELANYIKDKGIEEIIVYGAGNVGKSLVKALKIKNIKVNCIVDRNKFLWGTFIEGIEIISLKEALKKNLNFYVIASFDFKEEIAYRLKTKYSKLGIGCKIFSFDDIETK
ncbi:glycosyltransferase [Orenia marismortui]|uniref:C-methyltransferase-like protein n=1 Tax=Orenia marismortui TaxID=46469 RepID=A0A4R8HQB7_9FIRM|nr:glycosyltransferase [Orenia marismortui]TDX58923.1 C-methyltransferase-like protein [Orenia marismortui]